MANRNRYRDRNSESGRSDFENRSNYGDRNFEQNRGFNTGSRGSEQDDYGRSRSGGGGGFSNYAGREENYFGGGNQQFGGGYTDSDYDRDYDDTFGTGGGYYGQGSRSNYPGNFGAYGDRSFGSQRDRGFGSGYNRGSEGGMWGGSRQSNRRYDYDRGYGGQYQGQDRGWWDRTADEVSSWFGDEEAERRRRMDERQGEHRGRGPRNYTRSDDRIKEDINDRLTDHTFLDASNIDVEVNAGEVTLTGTVDSRWAKRQAEDIAEDISGVKNVENRLRVSTSTFGQLDSTSTDYTSDQSARGKSA
jgi:osmotically-inducible protein OsmY